jgi:hypothetical protein
VTVKPDAVYVERSETGQHLNCDFLLENLTDEELLLTGVELSVFGDGGRLARRDFVNRFSRTSLEIPPRRVLRAKQRALLFNPFHSFAASVPLKRLRYEFAFATDDGRVRHTSVAEVVPIVYETKTALVLPVKGRVLVWDGHDYHSHHRRMDYTLPVFQNRQMTTNFQRYGYDFVIVNEQGVMYRGAPKHSDDWYGGRPDDNESYFAFGQPVYAAGAGRVVDLHDGEADNRRFDPTEFMKRATAGSGNYVVIDHLNGEFSWFGHLKQGSIRVKRGQAVKQRHPGVDRRVRRFSIPAPALRIADRARDHRRRRPPLVLWWLPQGRFSGARWERTARYRGCRGESVRRSGQCASPDHAPVLRRTL